MDNTFYDACCCPHLQYVNIWVRRRTALTGSKYALFEIKSMPINKRKMIMLECGILKRAAPPSCLWTCRSPSSAGPPSWTTPGCPRCRPARNRLPPSSSALEGPAHRGSLWCHTASTVPLHLDPFQLRPRTRPPGSRSTLILKSVNGFYFMTCLILFTLYGSHKIP